MHENIFFLHYDLNNTSPFYSKVHLAVSANIDFTTKKIFPGSNNFVHSVCFNYCFISSPTNSILHGPLSILKKILRYIVNTYCVTISLRVNTDDITELIETKTSILKKNDRSCENSDATILLSTRAAQV